MAARCTHQDAEQQAARLGPPHSLQVDAVVEQRDITAYKLAKLHSVLRARGTPRPRSFDKNAGKH